MVTLVWAKARRRWMPEGTAETNSLTLTRRPGFQKFPVVCDAARMSHRAQNLVVSKRSEHQPLERRMPGKHTACRALSRVPHSLDRAPFRERNAVELGQL